MNFALPRTVGLPNEDELFEHYYVDFESDLFGPDLAVTIQAVLGNVTCRSGFDTNKYKAVRFENFWRWEHSSPLNTHYLRDHVIPAIEVRRGSHAIANGRDISGEPSFLVAERLERHPKTKITMRGGYARSEEITRKTVLALRLVTGADAYSDYWGFRMLGHLSAFNMNLMNWPAERLPQGNYADLSGFEPAVEKLMISLFSKAENSLAVLDHRIGDALRRRQAAIANPDLEIKVEIDKLFDYVQALESLLPLRGSDAVRLSAAILISRSTKEAAREIDDFFKVVYQVRDDVMHGRLDKVIQDARSSKRRVNVRKLGGYIRTLGCLAILNDGLGIVARRMALGESVNLVTPFN